jgi:hypothetical protein
VRCVQTAVEPSEQALRDKYVYNGTDTKAAWRAGLTDRGLQVRAPGGQAATWPGRSLNLVWK